MLEENILKNCVFVPHTEKPGKPGTPDFSNIKDTALTLHWSAPESDGGAEIFNYIIEHRVEGGFKWIAATTDTVPTTQYNVTKLKEAATYEFRVAAENKAGVGPFSDPSQPVLCKEPVGK